MATESFNRSFVVDFNSQKCIEKIMKKKQPTVINVSKVCKKVTREDLAILFGNGINKRV